MNTRELTAVAAVLFAAIAIFFGPILRGFTQGRRLKPPHRTLQLIFRLWFAALALASIYLALHRPN